MDAQLQTAAHHLVGVAAGTPAAYKDVTLEFYNWRCPSRSLTTTWDEQPRGLVILNMFEVLAHGIQVKQVLYFVTCTQR